MPKDNYRGIKQEINSYIKRSGSKFYGYLYPIKDEEEAQQHLSDLHIKYPDATHICYAYIIGVDRDYQRFSDDGEPTNSAGRPILNHLLSSGLNYLLCAVVRYYGGKKLGVPGLIEAYGTACRDCLEAAEIEECVLMDLTVCTIGATEQYKLYNYLHTLSDVHFNTDGNKFYISCSKSMTPMLRDQLLNLPTLAIVNAN